MSVLQRIWLFLSSLKLSVILLVLLFILTWLGTLHQADHGLHSAIQEYFDAWVVTTPLPFGDNNFLTIPLPGARPVMILLFINLLAGGILRARKGWRQIGILMAHVSILWILLAGFISQISSNRGSLLVHEGETKNSIQSTQNYAIKVTEINSPKNFSEFVLPNDLEPRQFSEIRGKNDISVEILAWTKNSRINKLPSETQSPIKLINSKIDGTVSTREFIESLPQNSKLEFNIPAIYVRLVSSKGKTDWVISQDERAGRRPQVLTLGDKIYQIELGKMTSQLPFSLKLEKFRVEYYPNSHKPKSYESDVLINDTMKTTIKMNEPLRFQGFSIYQASWGPQNADLENSSVKLFSQFEVVNNPVEKWPEYATYLASLGLILHFSLRLFSRKS